MRGRDSRTRSRVFFAIVAVELVAMATVVVAYGNPQNDHDFGSDVAIDSRGRIVVVGAVHNSVEAGHRHLAVWRFSPDGTPDVTFCSIGKILHTGDGPGIPSSAVASVIIDHEGRILATGGTGDSMAVWRFDAEGTPDNGFNSTGFLTQYEPAVEYGAGGAALVLDSNGRILVAGDTWNGSDSDLTVWRFTADGTLDTTFNSLGYFVADSSADGWGRDSAVDIALDSQGRILVVGQLRRNVEPGRASAAVRLLRYHPDGTPDTMFNSVGHARYALAPLGRDGRASSVALDASGRIVVAGTGLKPDTNEDNQDMVTWRLNANGTLDTSFNGIGYLIRDGTSD